MTYEDNNKKRSTLPVVGCVCAFASDLCFLDDIQLRTLVFVDGKVLWLFKKSNNSKTMETTKEEMMMLLRELQELQMWLLNRGSKLTLAVVFGGEHFFSIIARLITDRDLAYRAVDVSERKSFNDNVDNLEDFMEYVTKLEYARKKSESNHTSTGK